MELQKTLDAIDKHFSEISDDQLDKNLREAGYCKDCSNKDTIIKELVEELEHIEQLSTSDIGMMPVIHQITKTTLAKHKRKEGGVELRECPFCGGKVEFEFRDYNDQDDTGDDGTGYIICNKCGFKMFTDCVNGPEEWNTRASDATIKELVEALDKACRSVSELIGFSRGVEGLHLNGDIAELESLRTGGRFESWLIEFDEACEALAKYKTPSK